MTSSRRVITPPPTGITKFWSRFWVSPLHGHEANRLLARRECPHCPHLLPPDIEDFGHVLVGLVGSTATGKSTYIASLVHMLERQGTLERLGCSWFRPADEAVRERYRRDFYNPLFIDRTRLQPNPPLEAPPPPLVYTMLFGEPGSPNMKRIQLILYDAAGERLKGASNLVLDTRYVLNAKALIFLVDPLAIPAIRENLPQNFRPSPKDTPSDDAFEILNDVYDVCRREFRLKDGQKLNMPVAIALSKADLLRYCKPVAQRVPKPRFLEDPEGDDRFDPADVDQVSNEVENILRELAAGALMRSASFFGSVTYHAVSATGHATDAQGKYPMVTPWRCVDPLVSVLRQLGVIHTAGTAKVLGGLPPTNGQVAERPL